MKRISMAALAALLGGLALAAQAAPEVFTDFDGKPRSIESYAGGGKWLVVMIWASDCRVCNQEAGSYARFHQAHKDRDATLLGVSIDGQDKKADAEAFIQRHELPFPNLLGEPQTSMLYYTMKTGAPFTGTPTILLYGPDGQLQAAQAGAVPPEVIEDFMANNAPPAKAG